MLALCLLYALSMLSLCSLYVLSMFALCPEDRIRIETRLRWDWDNMEMGWRYDDDGSVKLDICTGMGC